MPPFVHAEIDRETYRQLSPKWSEVIEWPALGLVWLVGIGGTGPGYYCVWLDPIEWDDPVL